MRTLLLAAPILLGAALAAPAADAIGVARAPGLVPHRAVYALSRERADPAADVAAVRGQLELRFEATCDGWRMLQMLGFRLYDSDGGVAEHVAHLDAWEPRGGTEYWFETRGYENRELTEDVAGHARLERPGGPGVARFARPDSREVELPAGTLFPVGHIEALLDAAAAGARRLARTVFDGSTEDSLFEVSALIGRQRPAPADAPRSLRGLRAWPMRLAWFPVPAVSALPDFEMSALVYENGVAGRMTYDYGTFAMAVTLTDLEVGDRPACR